MSKTTQKQVKIDKAMLTKALQVQTAPPPKVAYKIDGVSGTDVFEECLLQFGKIPEVSGYMFVVDYANPGYILAAYAPGTWSRARVVSESELAAMKGEVETVAPTTETPAEPVAEVTWTPEQLREFDDVYVKE